MAVTKLTEKFLDSTRGRIVILLRGTTGTVNKLAEELNLTDNAVRANLLSLERDGLVKQAGIQRGHRKPHFAYELTPEAENLFPKAYDILFNETIRVLKEKSSPDDLKATLQEVGRSLGSRYKSNIENPNLENRVERAVEILKLLGGAAEIERKNDTFLIQGKNCPLATAVVEHPEACQLAEALVSEITSAKVKERCDKNRVPHCLFEIRETA